MYNFLDVIQDEMKTKVENLVAKTLGLETYEKSYGEIPEKLHDSFRLPIEYLPKEELHPLSETVCEDLELVVAKGEKSMYDQLFKPSHILGQNMIQNWKMNFTSNQQYLLDSQNVILESDFENDHKNFFQVQNISDTEFISIWDELKMNHEYFLEKYCYVEFDMFESFNRSSTFLQILSIINMMSPVISLLLPILFLIIPFVILKLRNIPITFSVYVDVLKDIAKSHFIGRTINNLSNFSIKNSIYLLGGLFMFCYQIYQNVLACKRFYTNIKKISSHLYILKNYLGHSIHNMELFIIKHKNKLSMKEFNETTYNNIIVLKDAYSKLEKHLKMDFSAFDSGAVGFILKNYYEFHSNIKYERAIRYAFGFDGYLDNIKGVQENIQNGIISTVNMGKKCIFKDQFYPIHIDNEVCIKNNCDLRKKNIVTGPNASGKTTYLKTTTINIIFSQQIGGGFYNKGSTINPYTHIHSYLNIPDTSERDSLFQAESRRCREIITIIHGNEKGRHFGIFDELYSGTNPEEATKAGYAFLKYLSKYNNVDFILTTHYNKICTRLLKNKQIQNYKMDVLEDKIGDLTYTYKIQKGISKIQGAIKILEQMDYPIEILEDVRHFNKNKMKKTTKNNSGE